MIQAVVAALNASGLLPLAIKNFLLGIAKLYFSLGLIALGK